MTELQYNEFLKSETDLEREASLYVLEHHGVKGQKWGDKNGPPYPLNSKGKEKFREKVKKRKEKEKKEGFLERRKRKKEEKVKIEAAKKKQAEAAARKKEKDAAKKKEAEKDKIREKLLTSTDAEFINKHKDLLTYQELNDRINRINLDKKIGELAKGKKEKSALKKGEEFLNSVGNMATSVGKIAEAYTKTYNAMNTVSKMSQTRQDNNRRRQEEAERRARQEREQREAEERRRREERERQREAEQNRRRLRRRGS